MKTRLRYLAAVAGLVLLCGFAIYAQKPASNQPAAQNATAARTAHAANPAAKIMSHKDHPFGQAAQIHLLPSGCRSQETVVHANGKDETPPGMVTFYSPTTVVLTFNPKGVLDEDDKTAGTITVNANQPKTVKVLANAGFGEVITQYRIGACNPPSNFGKKNKKEHTDDLSDPNDVIVP